MKDQSRKLDKNTRAVKKRVRKMDETIGIVMPAYNEEACIVSVVRKWLTVLNSIDGMLIVVNDGSKDKTGALLDKLKKTDSRLIVVHQSNSGHGTAITTGYRAAIRKNVTYVFQTDSDDQFEVKDFWKLWELRHQSDFILGFRLVRQDARHRLVITKFMRFVIFMIFGVNLIDANVPFRLIDRDLLESFLNRIPGSVFAPNMFLSILAAREGLELFDIPIIHSQRKTGTVSIIRWKLLKVCFRSFLELWHFRCSLSVLPPIQTTIEEKSTPTQGGIPS